MIYNYRAVERLPCRVLYITVGGYNSALERGQCHGILNYFSNHIALFNWVHSQHKEIIAPLSK